MPRMPTKAQRPVKAGHRLAPRRTIMWLASYPKSGNTWVRMFLANYLLGAEQPLPINDVHRFAIGDALAVLYHRVNHGRYDPRDLQGHLRLRGNVMRAITGQGADLSFVKTHNRNATISGIRLIDPMFTKGAIYIVRDPRDVAISYARHYGTTPSAACREISHEDNGVVADRSNVTQYLGNWSRHVRDWTRAKGFKVHTIRYEDMKADPQATFEKLLGFIGLPVDQEKLERAVRFSSFDELKAQEAKTGFIERSRNSDSFFYSGTLRQWEGVLTDDDLAYLTEQHGPQMKRFGYL